MNCNACGHVVKLRAEFCPNCGQRIAISMDDIIATSHDDLASRQTESLNSKLRTGIAVMLVALSVIIGIILLYDRKIQFDGSALPSLPANASMASGGSNMLIEKPFVDPRPLPPLPLQSLRVLGHRRGTLRQQVREANGGGARAYDTAINNGLLAMSRYQMTDGGWPVSLFPANNPLNNTAEFAWGRVGVSSLVLLAYFGDGHIWLRDGVTIQSPHSENTRRGVRYLVSLQDTETGRFGGADKHFMYNHAMATLAICEAAALTGNSDLNACATKGVEYIIKTQTERGGWDYYGHVTSDIDDISVSAWQVQALAAAREAGIAVPNATFEKALQFFTKLTKGERGIYNFQNDDGQFVPARSGMVLTIRQLLGDSPSNPDIRTLASKLVSAVPVIKSTWGRGWNPNNKDAIERSKFDPYMMYFCTYGMFFVGGTEWNEWNAKGCKAILDMQDTDGSWRSNDTYSMQGGTLYSTALSVLALQAHHRILHSVVIKNVPGSKAE
ncbi:MAG: prenyltransferase/squalene oxidase repeat-containing protein [Planctomycetota bacterium]